MIEFLLLFSIFCGVFISSDLFLDYMNHPKFYIIVINSIIVFFICFTTNDGLSKLFKSLKSHRLYLGVIVICFLSSLLGFLQFFGVVPSNHSAFPITGTFENPAGFAAVQSSMLPFVLVNCYLKDRGSFERLISAFVLLFCFITIVLSGSRTGILAACLAIVLVYTSQKKILIFIIRHKYLLLPLISVFIFLIILLYNLKPDSVIGRWFIWNRCFEMIKDRPWFGYGIDGFHRFYMEYQADYFRSHPESPYIMLADNVRQPFNEYIKLTIQFGVIGLFVGILLFVHVLHGLLKCDEQTKILGISFMISLFITSLFSYPYIYAVVWLFTFIAIFPAFQFIMYDMRVPRMFRFAINIFLLVILFFTTRQMYYEMKWTEISKRATAGKTRRMLPNYRDVEKVLGNNVLFLYNYAAVLNHIGQNEESLELILKCKEKWDEYYIQLLLADNYKQIGQKESAIIAYEEAHNMVPCRFEPIYGQFLVYCEWNDTIKVIQTANEILEKPIKVQSERVKQIIAHANQAIDVYYTE